MLSPLALRATTFISFRQAVDHIIMNSEILTLPPAERYQANSAELIQGRLRVRRLLLKFNATQPGQDPPADMPTLGVMARDVRGQEVTDVMGEERRQLFAQILGVERSRMDGVEVEPPFYCDYGEWLLKVRMIQR